MNDPLGLFNQSKNFRFNQPQHAPPTAGAAPAPLPQDPLQSIQQGRLQQIRQLQGGVQHENGGLKDWNAPTGIDWLGAHDRTGGQSWEVPTHNAGSGGDSIDRTPDYSGKKVGEGGRVMMGPHGGGFSVNPNAGDTGFGIKGQMEGNSNYTPFERHTGMSQGSGDAGSTLFKQNVGGDVMNAYNQALQRPSSLGRNLNNTPAGFEGPRQPFNALDAEEWKSTNPVDSTPFFTPQAPAPAPPTPAPVIPYTPPPPIDYNSPFAGPPKPQNNTQYVSGLPQGFLPKVQAGASVLGGQALDLFRQYVLGQQSNEKEQALERMRQVAAQQDANSHR